MLSIGGFVQFQQEKIEHSATEYKFCTTDGSFGLNSILIDHTISRVQIEPKSLMKRCDYCGHESADSGETCPGCGSIFPDPSIQVAAISKPFPWRPLIECLGYLAAIPIAFFGAIFAQVASHMVIDNTLISYIITGFCGVFLGALCFPRFKKKFRNPIFGSVLLLVFGLDFELHVLGVLNPTSQAYGHGLLISVPEIIATAIGGLAAGALHYWLSPREDANCPPSLPVGPDSVKH